MSQQAALGDFVFSIQNDMAFDSWTRTSDGGFVGIERANQFPASQQTGRGLDTLTLSGQKIGLSDGKAMDKLRSLQGTGRPQSLVMGTGEVLGQWKIMRVTERRSRVIDDGRSMVTDFTVDLEAYVQ